MIDDEQLDELITLREEVVALRYQVANLRAINDSLLDQLSKISGWRPRG